MNFENVQDLGIAPGLPKAIAVRRMRQHFIAGDTFRGKPIVEDRDSYCLIYRHETLWGKKTEPVPWAPTRSKFFQKYEYVRTSVAGDWRKTETRKRKGQPLKSLHFFYIPGRDEFYDRKPPLDLVIQEAKKYGFNVTENFLRPKLESWAKKQIFLPDKSGIIFTPIGENGISVYFLPFDGAEEEYIC